VWAGRRCHALTDPRPVFHTSSARGVVEGSDRAHDRTARRGEAVRDGGGHRGGAGGRDPLGRAGASWWCSGRRAAARRRCEHHRRPRHPTEARSSCRAAPHRGLAHALFEHRRKTMSFVFQAFNLFPELTALENVRFRGRDAECAVRRRGRGGDRQVGLAARHTTTPRAVGGSSTGGDRSGPRGPATRCCSPTNPPASSTSTPGWRSSGCCAPRPRRGGPWCSSPTTVRSAGRGPVVQISAGRIVSDGPPAAPVRVAELRW